MSLLKIPSDLKSADMKSSERTSSSTLPQIKNSTETNTGKETGKDATKDALLEETLDFGH